MSCGLQPYKNANILRDNRIAGLLISPLVKPSYPVLATLFSLSISCFLSPLSISPYFSHAAIEFLELGNGETLLIKLVSKVKVNIDD